MRYAIWVTVEKCPDNEVSPSEWEEGQPRGSDVAMEVGERIIGQDLDTGWVVTEVRA